MKKIIVFIVMIMNCYTLLRATEKEFNCGRLRMIISDDGGDEFFYPADFIQEKSEVRYSELWFMSRDWTNESGQFFSKAVENGISSLSIRKIVRYPYPKIIVDGVDVSYPEEYEAVDPEIPADQIIEAEMNTSMGVKLVKRAYAFSHPDYQDFVIYHYRFINNGETDEMDGVDLPDQTINDFYFIDSETYSPGWKVDQKHHPGDDAFWADYYGDETSDSLQICYGWDGDDPSNGPYDDEGNPHSLTGEFLTPQYDGNGVIHLDHSVDDRSHDASKVVSVFRIGRSQMDAFIQSGEQFFSDVTIPSFPGAVEPDVPGADPKSVQFPAIMMTMGPFNMAFGDTIHIIYFRGVGARSIEECRTTGAKWISGIITDEQKNTFIRWGKADLFNKLSKAKKLWKNDFQLPGGFNPQPPDRMSVTSGPKEVEIEWSAVNGAVGYNLYRAVGVQDSALYIILKHGLTQTSYIDTTVQVGFSYYYGVTAYNDAGVESSRYLLNSSRKAVLPYSIPEITLMDVRVVPNPFKFDREGNYTGEPNKIIFAGLPGPCRIKIITQSGDLVAEIEHTTDVGIHEWTQISKYNQYIASGIYIYYVESTEGKGSAIGKFVVIR